MKQRKPTDSTIRNVQAGNKKFSELKAEVRELKKRLEDLARACREFGIEM